MKAQLIIALLGGLATSTAAVAEPVSYDWPEETAEFKAGPGVEIAQANCAACHSADYINTQPHGAAFGRDFWQAEVTKMIQVFGAPISEQDAKAIVNYLANTY